MKVTPDSDTKHIVTSDEMSVNTLLVVLLLPQLTHTCEAAAAAAAAADAADDETMSEMR